jgi:hypothetical protein
MSFQENPITFQAPLNQTCIIYNPNKRRPEHKMLPIPLMLSEYAGRNLSPYAVKEEDLRMYVLSGGIRVWKFYTEVIEEHPDGSTYIWTCPKSLFEAMPTSIMTKTIPNRRGLPGFYARRFPSGAFEIRIHRLMVWEEPVERPYVPQEIIEEYYVKCEDSIEYKTTCFVKEEDEADEAKEKNMYVYNRTNKASEKYADFDQSICRECGGYYDDHRICDGMTREEIAYEDYERSQEWLFR